jgi:hypothetical protein
MPRHSQLTITPDALDLISAHHAGTDAYHAVFSYVSRQFTGDWGEVDADDRRANDAAAQNGGQILSAYTQPCYDPATCQYRDHKLWIVTDPGHHTTTVVTPQEYH